MAQGGAGLEDMPADGAHPHTRHCNGALNTIAHSPPFPTLMIHFQCKRLLTLRWNESRRCYPSTDRSRR